MDVFGNALDTIIVGALAIPWVLLAFHLFFPEGIAGGESKVAGPSAEPVDDTKSSLDGRVRALFEWVKGQNQTAVAGVLLFAAAYFIGSGVSRIAQDFFDDNDLHLWPTETIIRINVQSQVEEAIQEAPVNAPEKQEAATTDRRYGSNCTVGKLSPEDVIFHIREAAVLLKGTDANESLYQYHNQIMVLRGAAFSGLVAFSLCLFWWSAHFRSRLAWVGVAIYFCLGIVASINHFRDRKCGHAGPPYMEFTLFALAATGFYLLWRYQPRAGAAGKQAVTANGQGRIKAAYLILSAFLTFAAFFGWWATEVLYDQQVIYSFMDLSAQSRKPATGTAQKP
jgi:hypothetical protein